MTEKLNNLHVFYVVARAGSLTEASHILHVSVPAISQSLSNLEEAYATQLLIRSRRGTKLTEQGEVLLTACAEIFAIYENVGEQIATKQGEICGNVTIGSPLNLGSILIPKHIAELQKLYPELHVNALLRSSQTTKDNIVEALYQQQCDVAIVEEASLANHTEHIATEYVANSTFITVASSSYLKKFGTPIKRSDLRRHTWIDWNSKKPLQQIISNNKPLNFKRDVFINNSLAVRQAMLEGLGITALPLYSVADSIKRGETKQIMAKTFKITVPLHICLLKSRQQLRKVAVTVEYLRKALHRDIH